MADIQLKMLEQMRPAGHMLGHFNSAVVFNEIEWDRGMGTATVVRM